MPLGFRVTYELQVTALPKSARHDGAANDAATVVLDGALRCRAAAGLLCLAPDRCAILA